MNLLTCAPKSSQISYPIKISYSTWNDQNFLLTQLSPHGSQFAIITDDQVAKLYGNSLEKCLSTMGFKVTLLAFSAGEQYKTRATKELIEDYLFAKGFGKDTCIIALGGGVVTDLAGYIAATYCRGLPLVMMPTSLLGMIDACIGGKTGVNTPYGKNLLGCIYQPKAVLIDLALLESLPHIELKNGLVEMIKHGLVADHHYFTFLEQHVTNLLNLAPTLMQEAVYGSCRLKSAIVECDERELGKRHLLNFGHTVGHALECLSSYTIAHGEAVAIGILVESHMAMQLGALTPPDFDRIKKIFIQLKIPFRLPESMTSNKLINLMALDKKSLKGSPRFVILNGIGIPLSCDGAYCAHIEPQIIQNALQWMFDDLCCH